MWFKVKNVPFDPLPVFDGSVAHAAGSLTPEASKRQEQIFRERSSGKGRGRSKTAVIV
jgi:hypothetical protein